LGLVLAVSQAEAQSTAGAQSLLITPGARADGMGRAYIALAEDPTAVWWNPGGLAFTNERSATLMHTKLVPGLADDVYYEYLGYSQPLEGVGGLGANIIYLTYGKSTAVTDEEENLGEFTSYEVAATGSLGFEVTPNFGFGAALKYVYVDLAPEWATPDRRDGSGSSFAVDLGLLYRNIHTGLLSSDRLNLAVVLTNLGPNISFIDEGQSSPLGHIVKMGLMYEIFDTGQYGCRVSYDFNQPVIVSEDGTGFFDRFTDFKRPLFRSREEPIQHFGAEATYHQEKLGIAARFGYVHDPDGDIKDPTFGLGFGIGQFKIDWAMVPQARSLEDNVHKFSVTATF
jgi:hypothetical protein